MPDISIKPALRNQIEAIAGNRCEYCRSPALFATQTFALDHIIPRSKGGKSILDNLALACTGCNSHKHTRTFWRDSVTDEIVPLYHPRRQLWHEHFTWNDDYSQILGLTPTGRATVDALKLNRESLTNLRRALLAIGEHPPAGSLQKTRGKT